MRDRRAGITDVRMWRLPVVMGPCVLLAVLAVWPKLDGLALQKAWQGALPQRVEPYKVRLTVVTGNALDLTPVCVSELSSLKYGWLEFDRTLWQILPGEKPPQFDNQVAQPIAISPIENSLPTPASQKDSVPTNTLDKNLFTMGFRGERAKQSLGWQRDLEVANLNSKVVLIDSDPDANVPVRRNGWQREDTVKMPINDRFFIVGQFGANSDDTDRQAYKVVGRTGIGWKLPSWLGGEIQIRGGKSMTNYDSSTADIIPDKAHTFYEINTKWPVWRIFNLEYTQETQFASTSDEHDKMNQDFRVAMPISDTGQFHIGAKYYRYLDGSATTPWLERLQFYLGLQYKR